MGPSRGALRSSRAALAAAAAVAVVAPAATDAAGATPRGTVYGGLTDQGFPVVIETGRDGRTVPRATIGIRLPCATGGWVTLADQYTAMPVRSRRFAAGFGPETVRNDDGTTSDLQGSISGTFSRSGATITGTWSFKAVDHDATGAVTDTCDSGTVRWTARQ